MSIYIDCITNIQYKYFDTKSQNGSNVLKSLLSVRLQYDNINKLLKLVSLFAINDALPVLHCKLFILFNIIFLRLIKF